MARCSYWHETGHYKTDGDQTTNAARSGEAHRSTDALFGEGNRVLDQAPGLALRRVLVVRHILGEDQY